MEPIGIAESPYKKIENMPIQPRGAEDIEGRIRIYDPYVEGLRDLDGFSHIYLVYHFHKVSKTALVVTPFMDTVERGVFSTRSPLRPNHIGLSVVELCSVDKGILTIRGIDLLDGTPVLDVKPYIDKFDRVKNSRSGWMQSDVQGVAEQRSDDRFK